MILYILLSALPSQLCTAVPIVCLAIWHWYMFLGLWLQSLNGVALARTLNTKVGKSSCGTLPWEASRRKLCSRLGRTAPDRRLARCPVEPNGPDHPFPGPMSARETAPKRARGVLSNTNHFVNEIQILKFIPSMILVYCVFL